MRPHVSLGGLSLKPEAKRGGTILKVFAHEIVRKY
jgi:hypothetical protein